jgi:hypothetical protein
MQPPAGQPGPSGTKKNEPGGSSGHGKQKPPFCRYCKKPGHLIQDCRKRAAGAPDLEAKVNFIMEQLSAMGRPTDQLSSRESVNSWPQGPVPEGDTD